MVGNSCANLHKDDVNRCELISILSNGEKSIYLVTHIALLDAPLRSMTNLPGVLVEISNAV